MALDRFDQPPIAGPLGWLSFDALADLARGLIDRFGIRCQGSDAPVATLSGGNVQRLVLARTLDRPPEVLVLANPTFGLDIAAVRDVRGRVESARQGGAAVVLISEDLDELIALSDRILVMFEGRIVSEAPAGATRAEIGRAMAGGA